MIASNASPRQRGFSLIEVMVAVIVICIGLLGIAKMQALSLSNATTSRLRALAAIEAASLAAAMHSNREYWATTPPASVTLSATAGVASTDGALAAGATADYTAALPNPSTACVGTSGGGPVCSAIALAEFDLARWQFSVNNLLPNPTTTVLCPPAVGTNPVSCTIQIAWSEVAVAINAQQTNVAGAQFQSPTYTLYVEP